MQFELSYTDTDGRRQSKTIDCDFKTATKMAKELAKASGRRAVITKIERRAWRVYVLDGKTQEASEIWSGLTKREVLMRWRLWDERGSTAILIAMPHWFGRLATEESAG